MIEFLLAGGWIAPENAGGCAERGWVAIGDGRIAARGPGEPPEGMVCACGRVIDTSGCLVLPGLVNAHTHLSQTFMRGVATDKPLAAWLVEAIQPLQAAFGVEDMRLASLLGIVENLRRGVTAIAQHHKITATRDHVEAPLSAAAETGIRILFARGWRDRGPRGEPLDVIAREMRYLARAWDGSRCGRIRIGFGPLSTRSCSLEATRRMASLARDYGMPTHMHVAETVADVEDLHRNTGLRPIQWLDAAGALGESSQLVHCVHLDAGEMALLAARGARVVHCPVSNMRLGSGIAPVAALLDLGVDVCLGTDGAGSNDGQDMVESAKTAVLLAAVGGGVGRIAIVQAIEMATEAGARILGWPETGRLARGKPADIAVFDLSTCFAAPVNDPLAVFVMSSACAHAEHVFVDGRHLVDAGRVTSVDESTLLARCERAAAALFERAGLRRAVATWGAAGPPAAKESMSKAAGEIRIGR